MHSSTALVFAAIVAVACAGRASIVTYGAAPAIIAAPAPVAYSSVVKTHAYAAPAPALVAAAPIVRTAYVAPTVVRTAYAAPIVKTGAVLV